MACRCAASLALVVTAWGVAALPLSADPRWLLTYARQYGEYMTGGVAGQAELFAYDQRGRPVRIGMTNRWTEGFAIFGQTDQFGNARITDAVSILGHLFAQAGPLPSPFGTCGVDPTGDTIDCVSYLPCQP